MIKYLKLFSAVLVLCLTISSCVTRKKFDDLNASKSRLEAEKADCSEQLTTTTAERDRLSEQVSKLSEDNKILIDDTTQTGIILRKLQRNYTSLNDTYEQLLRNHDRLQSHSSSETSKLTKDLAKRESDLLASEKKINELQSNLEEREARVKELEKVLSDKDKAVSELKNKVSKALLSFKEKDLTVNIKNGKVYVSLSEDLLFKSGSTAVDKKGQEALKKLAEALRDQKDISIMVEGHTDDVPVSKGTVGIKDNWDLSVLRATEITRILTGSGIGASKIIPAGRAEFSPIAEGKTSDARQKNRRTEIILTPKLDELFKLLEAN